MDKSDLERLLASTARGALFGAIFTPLYDLGSHEVFKYDLGLETYLFATIGFASLDFIGKSVKDYLQSRKIEQSKIF